MFTKNNINSSINTFDILIYLQMYIYKDIAISIIGVLIRNKILGAKLSAIPLLFMCIAILAGKNIKAVTLIIIDRIIKIVLAFLNKVFVIYNHPFNYVY